MSATPNSPALWQNSLPSPGSSSHKHNRGHLAVLGGEQMTGAARMAAEAGMRMGCGLCTIITSAAAINIYRAGSPHLLAESYAQLALFAEHVKNRNAAVLGPGAGLTDTSGLQQAVTGTLALQKPVVLDADALSVFSAMPERLFTALHPAAVLTPHEGEFTRLFPDLGGDRTHKVRAAAARSRAIILLKGAVTLIATPDGQLIENTHATPWLATAGSGDVLAGMIGGLLAQGMPALLATAAAAWMHGEAGLRFGPGLTAPDIITTLPDVLRVFYPQA